MRDLIVRDLAASNTCLLKGSMCVVKLGREIHSARSVPKKLLRSVWKRISDKPLPDVYAFTLEEKEFLSNLELVQKNKRMIDTRVAEYGLKVPNQFIEALTFEFEGHLIIFVKQTTPLVDALEHELRHVASWNPQDKAP